MKAVHLPAALALVTLSSCNPAPPINFSVANVPVAPAKADADLRSITVTFASPTERTGPLPADGQNAIAPWKEALTDAVNRAIIFNDDSRRHANLSVKILKLDLPSPGFDMKTDVEARYELMDRKNGQQIFDQTVDSVGICPVGYAFVGVVRMRESVNRAVQANISDFILRLEKAQAPPVVSMLEPAQDAAR